MNFKEELNADLETFFNLEEFSEEHNIDGKDVGVIIDNDELKQRTENFGAYDADLLYFVETEKLTKHITTGSIQRFDNKLYEVVDVKDNDGISEIMLKGTGN